MKLVTFQAGSENRLGAVRDPWILDIGKAISVLTERPSQEVVTHSERGQELLRKLNGGGPAPADMVALLERGESWRETLNELLDFLVADPKPFQHHDGLFTALAGAHLCAPMLRPGKITAVGLNYAAHAREQGKEPPARPVFFLESSNAICGPGDPIILPVNSTQVDYEAEFAVVIGKRGSRIPEERAYEYIAGYTILNDVTARDLQFADRQWFRGKSCDTFAPIGPWIVTADEVPDPHNLRISLALNGQTMQDSNTHDLIFKIPFLVSYLSQSLTWEPGDILSTGTPGGVGVYRKPQVFLKPGDTLSVTVEKIGTLTNPVKSSDYE